LVAASHPYPLAYLAVVSGAVLGRACNLTISRKYGRPFVQRFGKYVGVTEARLLRAEGLFKRWGPWAIIVGRHIPGMRNSFVSFIGNTWGPLQGFHTMRICVISDLGGDLSRDRASRRPAYSGGLSRFPRTSDSMGIAGFGLARDRVSGI